LIDSDSDSDSDSDVDERKRYRTKPKKKDDDDDGLDPPGVFSLPTKGNAKIWTLTGHPGGGKSYMLRYIMYKYAQHRPHPFFRFGVVIAPTASCTGDYVWLSDHNPGAVWETYDEERLKAYMESLRRKRKELQEKTGDRTAMLPPNFCVVDDCIGMIKNSEWYTNFVSTARHTNTHLFFLNQYIAAARNICTTLRNNTNIALMWKQPMEHSVINLFKAYGGYYKNVNEFKERLLDDNGRKYSCLVYRSGYNDKVGSYLRIEAREVPDNFAISFQPQQQEGGSHQGQQLPQQQRLVREA